MITHKIKAIMYMAIAVVLLAVIGGGNKPDRAMAYHLTGRANTIPGQTYQQLSGEKIGRIRYNKESENNDKVASTDEQGKITTAGTMSANG